MLRWRVYKKIKHPNRIMGNLLDFYRWSNSVTHLKDPACIINGKNKSQFNNDEKRFLYIKDRLALLDSNEVHIIERRR